MAENSAISAASVCAACGQSATNRCVGCREGVDINGDPLATFYCSKDCQREHWSVHRSDCKTANARKQLYRVGGFTKKLFLDIRRTAWTIPIEKVEWKDQKLHIYEGVAPQSRAVVGLPVDLIHTEEEAAQLLLHDADEDVILWMQQIIEFSLGVAPSRQKSLIIKPKAESSTIFHAQDMNKPVRQPRHVIRVEYPDGPYVIDLTGAQYGLKRVVMPWDTYQSQAVKEIVKIGPYNESRNALLAAHQRKIKAAAMGPVLTREHTLLFLRKQIDMLVFGACVDSVEKSGVSLKALVAKASQDRSLPSTAMDGMFKATHSEYVRLSTLFAKDVVDGRLEELLKDAEKEERVRITLNAQQAMVDIETFTELLRRHQHGTSG